MKEVYKEPWTTSSSKQSSLKEAEDTLESPQLPFGHHRHRQIVLKQYVLLLRLIWDCSWGKVDGSWANAWS